MKTKLKHYLLLASVIAIVIIAILFLAPLYVTVFLLSVVCFICLGAFIALFYFVKFIIRKIFNG